jgi:hypothetical protein
MLTINDFLNMVIYKPVWMICTSTFPFQHEQLIYIHPIKNQSFRRMTSNIAARAKL